MIVHVRLEGSGSSCFTKKNGKLKNSLCKLYAKTLSFSLKQSLFFNINFLHVFIFIFVMKLN